jgi:formiminoglutamase
MKTRYSPPDQGIWQGRPSEQREYIHENIKLLDLEGDRIPEPPKRVPAIIGYACDEGVRRNLGRPGARSGPAAFRKALGKMPLHDRAAGSLCDAGDIHCEDEDLEATQQAFAASVKLLVKKGYMPLGIGGGHDIAYAHYLGLWKALGGGKRLGILNFDAHFDLRQPTGGAHSGSPFLQIAQLCEESGSSFDYGCIGIRKDANPKELWDRAVSLNVWVLERELMQPHHTKKSLEGLAAFLDPLDAVYLTLDLDGFSSSYAPGVSAASPMGYSPEAVFPYLEMVLNTGKLIGLDIAELSPPLDRDGQTSVLAAALVHKVLHHPGLF